MTATPDLEMLALARLGLADAMASTGVARAEGSPIEALLRRGLLAPEDAARAREHLARNTLTCACGERSLPRDDDLAFACPACRRSFFRRSGGAWVATKGGPPPGVGSRVGPLELVSVLGKGAQGTVFLARHVELKRLTALKVLPSAALDERKRKRFEREVESLARLNHPAIVKIHATFEVEGCLACEMELVKGETLEERIDRAGPLPWRDAAALVAKVARAVAHAHGAGVLHRDLKPANVLLREGSGEPLLADFGLSRLTDLSSSLTVAGAQLGTPFYMAPEAFGGDSSVATDVYGLGTILYQCLTALPPYREATLAALYHKASKGACEPTKAPGAPPDLEDIRRIAMAPAARDRYDTALALAQDLERLLAGERPSASSGSKLARAHSERRSKLARSLGAAVAASILLVVFAVVLRGRPRLPDSAAAPVDSVPGALAYFERPDTDDPARRGQALATLVAVVHGSPSSQISLLREVDAAIGRAPTALELRRVRALLDRARALPVLGDDLAAVGSLTDARDDLDQIALHAANAGLQGEDTVAIARSVWLAHKESRSAALLFALVAAQHAALPLRAEVAAALRASKTTNPRAQRLEHALAAVDRLAQLVSGDEGSRESPECLALARRMADEVPSLGRDAGLGRAPALVIAPLGPAMRHFWRSVQITEAIRSQLRLELTKLGDAVDDYLTPESFLLREILKTTSDQSKSDSLHESQAPPPRLIEAGAAVEESDPLLAGLGFDAAAGQQADSPQIAKLPGLGESTLALADRAIACARRFETATAAPTPTELNWHDHILRRSAIAKAQVHESLAEDAGDLVTRRAELTKAVACRRDALSISVAGGLFANLRLKDARRLAEELVVLGLLQPDEPALEFVPQADALRAEALRRRDPAAALEKAKAIAPRYAEAEAVCAFAAADRHQREAARLYLERLKALESKGEGAVMAIFDSTHVGAYLESKVPK